MTIRTLSSARLARVLLAGALLGAGPACTAAVKTDASSAFLIVDAILAASGAKPDTFGGSLASDVLTYVKRDAGGGTQVLVPTVFEDLGQVTFRLAMKDPGTATAPTTPSTANFITLTQYHVNYLRSDGRNTPGVDVPYPFDGALTITVGSTAVTASMTLVRLQAKNEAPLRALIGGSGALAISTIAEITFYGKDQSGHDVSVSGRISVNFADWGDPS